LTLFYNITIYLYKGKEAMLIRERNKKEEVM